MALAIGNCRLVSHLVSRLVDKAWLSVAAKAQHPVHVLICYVKERGERFLQRGAANPLPCDAR